VRSSTTGAALYPSTSESQWLEFYANYFPAVEVDSTFYAAPAEATIQRWIEITPAAFRFACKLPREITHTRRLRDCTAELNSFLRATEALAPKLQVILIQLPPPCAKDGKNSAARPRATPRDFGSASNFDIPDGIGRSDPPLKSIGFAGFGADTTRPTNEILPCSNFCRARQIFYSAFTWRLRNKIRC
jgi:hypothetical protein